MSHVDVLDQPESLKRPLLASVGLHAAIFATVAGLGYVASQSTQQWGDPNSLGGGAVGITPVARIPLPARSGIRNPVANDTESQIPAPPKTPPKAEKKPEPDAIPIKSRNAPKQAPQHSAGTQQKYRPYEVERPNQVYSSTGAATVSPMYSLAPGGGGVGSGSQSPFGYGFGWYIQLIQTKVAQNWRTEQVDPRLRTAPAVVVVFDLYRDGSARNLRVGQTSGNYALDQSALRAVAQASPFQPIPRELPNQSYPIELHFQLKR